MEENKNLVISYSYYVDKISAEEKAISEKIHILMLQVPTNEVVEELTKLNRDRYALMQKRRITVCKEYPEFLIKDFKMKEELYDFIDEDEPGILRELEIFFERVPDCLKKINFSGTNNQCVECVEYIEAKHREEGN